MSWQQAEAPHCPDNINCDPVALVIIPTAKNLGDFEVRRALPAQERQMVGPFIFFDQMGPAIFKAGKAMDVRPHLHIGISTITWLFEGSIQHKDNLGYDLAIKPGEINWMTAGSGIVHSERSPQSTRNSDAPLAGIQAWIALPKDKEEMAPEFHHYSADQIPKHEDESVQISLIAGSAWGLVSPVIVQSEILYAEVNLNPAKVLEIPNTVEERAIYIYDGELEIENTKFQSGSMVVLKPNFEVSVTAVKKTKFMLLGGAPMDGPRYLYWNFVSSSQERIEQAKGDWINKRFTMVPDDDEFIPLPSGET